MNQPTTQKDKREELLAIYKQTIENMEYLSQHVEGLSFEQGVNIEKDEARISLTERNTWTLDKGASGEETFFTGEHAPHGSTVETEKGSNNEVIVTKSRGKRLNLVDRNGQDGYINSTYQNEGISVGVLADDFGMMAATGAASSVTPPPTALSRIPDLPAFEPVSLEDALPPGVGAFIEADTYETQALVTESEEVSQDVVAEEEVKVSEDLAIEVQATPDLPEQEVPAAPSMPTPPVMETPVPPAAPSMPTPPVLETPVPPVAPSMPTPPVLETPAPPVAPSMPTPPVLETPAPPAAPSMPTPPVMETPAPPAAPSMPTPPVMATPAPPAAPSMPTPAVMATPVPPAAPSMPTPPVMAAPPTPPVAPSGIPAPPSTPI